LSPQPCTPCPNLFPYTTLFRSVHYFTKQGHKHIAMLKENGTYYQLQERFNAYRHALKDAGIPFKKQYVAVGDLTIEGGYQMAKEDRKSTRLNSSHVSISYAVFC